MHADRVFAADGASLGEPWTMIGSSVPSLVVCPVAVGGLAVTPALVQEIYGLALEWAKAASRPSRYELARIASSN